MQPDMSNKLAFTDHYPDYDGKRYKSMPMTWYDEKNWDDARFKVMLEKTIEDFLFYADRFGGVGS